MATTSVHGKLCIPVGLILAATLSLAGCSGSDTTDNNSGGAASGNGGATVQAPSGPVLCQTQFTWADGNLTRGGLGFLAKSSDGKLYGVTCAHKFNAPGPALSKAEWLSLPGDKPTVFAKVMGAGIVAGNNAAELDKDVLVFGGAEAAQGVTAWEIDSRALTDVGEKVWFPNRNAQEASGYKLMEGKVREAQATQIVIEFQERLIPEFQDGSPVISQATGQVIGMVGRVDYDAAGAVLMLTPARSIADAMQSGAGKPLAEAIPAKGGE